MSTIQELAELIFLKNENNAYLNISLTGLNTAFDLFSCCVNLVSQALVLYSGQQPFVVENLDPQYFKNIMERLHYAGIEFRIDILSRPPPEVSCGLFVVHTRTDKPATINDYALHLVSLKSLYVVRFALFHNIPLKCKGRHLKMA